MALRPLNPTISTNSDNNSYMATQTSTLPNNGFTTVQASIFFNNGYGHKVLVI